jgi:GTP cyclohydrolase I
MAVEEELEDNQVLYSKSRTENRREVKTAFHKICRVLLELGRDRDLPPGMIETPERVTRMWLEELVSGYDVDVDALCRDFDSEGYSGMVVLDHIPFTSTCEHHLVPFVGYAHVGYLPGGRVIGLSKVARLVNAYGRRLQIQERLTQQVGETLERNLSPRGVIVVVEAEHMCMTARPASPGRSTDGAPTASSRCPSSTVRST